VAERALDTDRPEAPVVLEEPADADHGVELEERQGGRGIVEVHPAALELTADLLREGVGVDLQTDAHRGLRAYAGADATKLRALDRLVQLQRIAPERLVAERVEPEDVSPVLDHRERTTADRPVDLGEPFLPCSGSVSRRGGAARQLERQPDQEQPYDHQ
jgi:hypothetical protein